MAKKLERYEAHGIENMILTVRGQKVILDRDLAALYVVPTFRFNEAVKRNRTASRNKIQVEYLPQRREAPSSLYITKHVYTSKIV